MATSDILVTGATVLYSNTATALPNINTVGFNAYGSWTSWTSLGVTASPVRMRFDKEYYRFDAQQYAAPILTRLVGKNLILRFEIAELTGATLALLLDGAHSTTAASSGVKGLSTIDFGADFTTTIKQWGIEGYRLDSAGTMQPVRWFIWRGALTLEGDFTFNKRDSTKAAVTIMCEADTTKSSGQEFGKVQIVTAPAS